MLTKVLKEIYQQGPEGIYQRASIKGNLSKGIYQLASARGNLLSNVEESAKGNISANARELQASVKGNLSTANTPEM